MARLIHNNATDEEIKYIKGTTENICIPSAVSESRTDHHALRIYSNVQSGNFWLPCQLFGMQDSEHTIYMCDKSHKLAEIYTK